jgi:SPP1 gp7 family putative phage head morphogenesis protein
MPGPFREPVYLPPIPTQGPEPNSLQIREINQSDWYTPLQPVRPTAPPGTPIHQYETRPGQNITWQPRGEEAVDFPILRTLADSWDLLRIVIETLKDRMTSKPWQVRVKPVPGETNKKRLERETNNAKVRELTKMLERPDGIHTWSKWLRMLLEDLLVIDAMTIYQQRKQQGAVETLKIGKEQFRKQENTGQIVAFRPIDGSTIARYVTTGGYIPLPPSPAYGQTLYGAPALLLTTDDLIYAPRNPRNHKLYGYSPVEQMLMTISIGLRRQMFLLNYYTEGNMPEGLAFLPPSIPPNQVKELQDWFDSVLSGNLKTKRRLRFLPGYGDGKQSPNVVFPKEPLLKSDLDDWQVRIVAYGFGMSPQQLVKMMNRATAKQSSEEAEEEGQVPIEQHVAEVANQMILAYDPASECEFTWEEGREVDALKQAQIDDVNLKNGSATINEVRARRGEDPSPEPEADMLGIITPQGFVPLDLRPGQSQDPPDDEGDQPGERPAPTAENDAVHKRKTLTIDPHRHQPQTASARTQMQATVYRNFRRIARATGARIRKQKASKASGDDTDSEHALAVTVDDAEWWTALWASLPPDVVDDLESAILAGTSKGLIELDIHVSEEGLISEVNALARDWAENRAAELVGMAWDEDGNLIANPDAQWVISETTRDELRQIITDAFKKNTPIEDIIQAIEDADTFSEARAEMIARTEVSRAQTIGNFEVWEKSELVQTVRWQTSADALRVCDDCDENSQADPVDLGDEFPSGDPYPPAHPNCRCVLIAVKIGKKEQVQ